jgi:hypothetical protein
MLIKAAEVENIIVLLNGRPLKIWHQADNEQGWVDTYYLGNPADLAKLRQIPVDMEPDIPQDIPIKRVHGEVYFVKVEG